MRIVLSGGPSNGEVLEVTDSLSVLSVPLLGLGHDRATNDDIKRHSWDDDALRISYFDYERTEMEADDGTVIFKVKEGVRTA